MNRTLHQLLSTERNFIDLAYVKKIQFSKISILLKLNRTEISQLNRRLRPVWKPITIIVKKWNSKGIGGSFWDFYYWHIHAEKKCFYCEVTELELKTLHDLGIENKRPKRGKTLEVDRKISGSKYLDIENLTYSCYWCNNAKTDTFSEAEAKLIGRAISEIWKSRLKNLT